MTSRYESVLVPCGSTFHWVPLVEERNESRLPDAPCRLKVLVMVWVVFAGNVRVAAEETDFVRLAKVVEPERVWLVPSSVTVPPFAVNVPPLFVQFPETVMMPVGAVNVPEEMVKFPFTSAVV